jgi:hypothetical protein
MTRNEYILTLELGDQIGRIFASWVTVSFLRAVLLNITKAAHIIVLLF